MDGASAIASYPIQYVGCIQVNVSIKSLNFSKQKELARECIRRVCEDVGLRIPSDKSSEFDSSIEKNAELKWARQSVRLSITVKGVTVHEFHSDKVFFHHPLSSVSFASCGDADMLDFVSYIAKNNIENSRRMCYVFYCCGGCSNEFICSFGEAFKLAYRGFKKKNRIPDLHSQNSKSVLEDSDPPSILAPTPPSLTNPWDGDRIGMNSGFDDATWLLQDDQTPAATTNEHVVTTSSLSAAPTNHNPFGQVMVQDDSEPVPTTTIVEPVGEPWYMRHMTRQKAESLLQYDGDFLVRASTQIPNQYVLSGMHKGKKRHLLLINPEGQVRTKDRLFKSIQELIDFHLRSATLIRSENSELKLVFPVSQSSLDL